MNALKSLKTLRPFSSFPDYYPPEIAESFKKINEFSDTEFELLIVAALLSDEMDDWSQFAKAADKIKLVKPSGRKWMYADMCR